MSDKSLKYIVFISTLPWKTANETLLSDFNIIIFTVDVTDTVEL